VGLSGTQSNHRRKDPLSKPDQVFSPLNVTHESDRIAVPLKLGLTAYYITREDLARARQLATRGQRCARRTRSGTVCQTRVARAGDACEWHRTAPTQ